jgi:hypothetical protein
VNKYRRFTRNVFVTRQSNGDGVYVRISLPLRIVKNDYLSNYFAKMISSLYKLNLM